MGDILFRDEKKETCSSNNVQAQGPLWLQAKVAIIIDKLRNSLATLADIKSKHCIIVDISTISKIIKYKNIEETDGLNEEALSK